MKHLNFLSNLLSLSLGSPCTDVSLDRRLTVGSPSFDCRSAMLKLVSVLVLILTIGSGNVWGDTYTITFKTAASDPSSEISTSTAINTIVSDGASYVKSLNTCTKCYGPAISGLKLGTGSATGTFKFTLSDDLAGKTIKSVTIKNVKYGSDSGNITGTATGTNTGALGTVGKGTDLVKDYGSSSKTKITTIQVATSSKRAYISKIIIETIEEAPSCSNSVALSKGSATNGTVNTISSASVATCSSTESDRRVTITITPDDCYDAPSTLTWTKSSGTVSASKQSGPTDNGNGTYSYVYQFAQNNNGAGTFGVTCTAKAAGKTVNFDAGPGVSASSSLTETCSGSGVTLPAVTATGVCKGWTTFAGWATAPVTDSTTTSGVTLYAAGSNYVPASNNMTLYAVYSKTKGGGSGTLTIVPDTYTNKGTNTYGSGAERTGTVGTIDLGAHYVTGNNSGTPGGSTTGQFLQCQGNNANIYNKTALPGKITQVVLNQNSATAFSLYCGTEQLMASNNTSTGQTPSGTAQTAQSAATQMTWTVSGNYTYFDIKKGSSAGYITSIVITYGSSTTYYCSDPDCCTPLGSINGSVSWSNPTEAVVSWDNLANVSSWTVACKVHGGSAAGTIGSITTNGEGKKTCTITGLTCNTDYDFTITANPAIGYCEKEETLENKNSGKWNVAYSLTGVTKSSGPATGANVCGDYTAVFTPSNAAYALPSDVTVQIGGVTKTKDTDYTWDSSTGTLSIASNKITGDLSITVTGILVGCSADPTIGAASLSGAFGLSSVGVTVGTSSTGSAYCAWTDYGFVWGTSADPTVSDNKVQIGNSDAATTWSGNLTGSFSVGTTYYFRAYGTNSKTGAVPVYGTGNSFTPRSVTFDSNGGSAVAIVYVNSGSAVSEPSAPTRTGYDFVKWQLSGADYIFSSAVNANITLVAVWGAKSYTVTLDQQSGSGGTESVSATYDADMPSATMPTRSGYDFGGYYGSEGGAGTQYYAADGSSAHPWDVANATTIYAKWTAKNYTITLNNEGADSGKEGTASISVTFDANTNLTSAIMKPVRDGYQFGGYFTSTDGSGTQIIDENGNVKASVTSYTSATKQWIYANDIELHAYWKPSYTVTWSVNGETTTEQVVSGEQVAALPTDPTSSDCDDAKVFVGWRSTAIDGVSAANPGSIFTTKAASPAITGDVTFYAVFADDNEETKHLTNSELETFYGTTTNRSYANGPFTITSSDGDWYGVCAAAYSTPSYYYVNIKSDNVTISAVSTRPYLRSPIYSSDINRITITHNSSTDRTLLICSSASVDPATDKIATISITNSNKSGVYADISSGVSQLYLYSSSGAIPIMSIDVNIGTPSNYVTSCSSCDADATFTNTTPAVSAIDCDAATLTMTGGLATLGADGCNVSDYGFVIGTTDNPAIGGSGVTKLQVGTTNPTIGADFSYDAEGLTAGTHYYIRAYAINRHGTAYSGSQNFWTKGVSSIAITTAPTKTNYIVGETFDATGMVVTATMASGATEDVTGDVTYSGSALTAGASQNFPINYTLCETEKSVNQVINVYTLSVTEGTNDSYGTATNSSANIVSITGLGDHKTYTVTVTSSNATAVDNGDNTWSIINPTGNVTVRVDYADAVQVKVYYKVDGVTVTGLTQDVYQSETTTLPTASELATEMTAQGMEIPDDSYPNFVGWSETEFGAQTSAPTLVTGTPTINAEKTYYAVFTNLGKKTILPTDFPNSYGDGDRVIDGVTYYRSGVANPSGSIQFRASKNGTGYIYSKTSLAYILKIEVSGANLVINACSDASGTLEGEAITPVGTAPRVYTFPANKQYFQIKGNGETNTASRIDIYYSPATVEYMTQFCTRYDITGVTKSGTAVTGGTLSSNYNSACEGKSVELEAVVSTGYQFNGWTIKKTADLTQDVTSTLLGANASSLTPPAFSMPDYAITVSASITEKELTGWTWKQALPDATQIAIPSKVVLYVGQQARFELFSYDPSDVLAEKKGYNADYIHADLAQDNKGGAYYVTRAKQAQESTTLTLTSTSNSSVQEVINIQIKALPSVTFEDHVHSVVFSAVAATIDETDKRIVYLTKTTPTTSDFSGTTYNSCEEQHEHLVGWIESSWADEHPNATHSEIAGADAGVFYTAGADIDVEAQNGKTFYAVWSKIE